MPFPPQGRPAPIPSRSVSERDIVHIDDTDSVYTATTEHLVVCDVSAGNVEVELGEALQHPGRSVIIADDPSTASTNLLQASTATSVSILGDTVAELDTNNESSELLFTGSQWIAPARYSGGGLL